jgi:hypothetical protein
MSDVPMSDIDVLTETPPAVRRGPALIVLGIALLVVLGGAVIALLPSAKSSNSLAAGGGNVAAGDSGLVTPGSGISVVPVIAATAVLARVESGGAVPRNIDSSLTIPQGARLVGTTNFDGGSGQFDRLVKLSTSYSMGSLVANYQTELALNGWKANGTTAVANSLGSGTQILATHPGSDGYYWEVGVTIYPGTLKEVSSALATSRITLRLLQIADGN